MMSCIATHFSILIILTHAKFHVIPKNFSTFWLTKVHLCYFWCIFWLCRPLIVVICIDILILRTNLNSGLCQLDARTHLRKRFLSQITREGIPSCHSCFPFYSCYPHLFTDIMFSRINCYDFCLIPHHILRKAFGHSFADFPLGYCLHLSFYCSFRLCLYSSLCLLLGHVFSFRPGDVLGFCLDGIFYTDPHGLLGNRAHLRVSTDRC